MIIGNTITKTLVSNTLVEQIEPWRNKSYDLREEAEYNNKIYRSTKSDNTQEVTNPLYWHYLRPSNTMAWSDEYPSTVSTSSQDIELVFENVWDATFIAFGNMIGTEIMLRIEEDEKVVLIERIPLLSYEEPQDAWEMEYSWGEVEQLYDYLYTIEQMYADARVTIRVTARDGMAQIGILQIGQKTKIGCTYAKVVHERTPLASFVTIENKRHILGGEGWSEKSFTLWFDDEWSLYSAIKKLEKLTAKSNLFIGDDTGNRQEYTIFGIMEGFSFDLESREASFSVYSLDAT